MSRLTTRLAAALAPVALLLPVASHAETVTVDDAVGDAKALNFVAEFLGSESEGPLFLDAPAEAGADIVSTTVEHARKRVTLTLRFRDLSATTEHSIETRVFTPKGRYSLSATRSADGSAEAQLWPDGGIVAVAGDEPTIVRPCRSVRVRYDLDADTVTSSFPTACIEKAPWVQVGILASRFSVTPLGDGSVNLAGFADDAFRASLSERSRARSPKVRRG